MTGRIDAYLVCGGRFHDFDFARLELLKLLAEHDEVRVRTGNDYADIEGILASSFLVTYTCDVRPTPEQQEALAGYVAGGGRWFALHGTNAMLDMGPDGVRAPRGSPRLMQTLGSQFIAHPVIQAYQVDLSDAAHPLVAGISPFETSDELYLSEYHGEVHALLETHYSGNAPGFIESDWTRTDRHLVAYLKENVYYLTLGHCRGHYDMHPLVDHYPNVERGSWEAPEYYELLRRGLQWAMGSLEDSQAT
jgi:type 1 glutamine amidotransferase